MIIPDLQPGARVRASPDGLTAFPDLRHMMGTVDWCQENAACVVWDGRNGTTIMAPAMWEAVK